MNAPRWLPLLLPVALLAGAALSDLRRRRIPNRITLALALAGCVRAAVMEGAAGVSGALLAMAAALLVLLIPFARGWLGAGDVKLLVAASAWLGLAKLPSLLLLSALAGGALAAAAYLRAPAARRRAARHNLALIATGAGPLVPAPAQDSTVPLGVAIAAAASLLLVTRWGA